MALEQKLRLKLAQRLVMTPSLQQAIKLLQLSRIELEETLAQEILENPVLDVEEPSDETTPAEGVSPAEADRATAKRRYPGRNRRRPRSRKIRYRPRRRPTPT